MIDSSITMHNAIDINCNILFGLILWFWSSFHICSTFSMMNFYSTFCIQFDPLRIVLESHCLTVEYVSAVLSTK